MTETISEEGQTLDFQIKALNPQSSTCLKRSGGDERRVKVSHEITKSPQEVNQ